MLNTFVFLKISSNPKMAAASHLKIALVIVAFLFSVKCFQDRKFNHDYSSNLDNSIIMADSSEGNMKENYKHCCFHKFDHQKRFATRAGKRGGKAALLDMVDYVTDPHSVAGGVKPKGQFTRAWKNILNEQYQRTIHFLT